jgi:hypothetical protein
MPSAAWERQVERTTHGVRTNPRLPLAPLAFSCDFDLKIQLIPTLSIIRNTAPTYFEEADMVLSHTLSDNQSKVNRIKLPTKSPNDMAKAFLTKFSVFMPAQMRYALMVNPCKPVVIRSI